MSKEKFQALTTNIAPRNISSIDNQPDHSSKPRLHNGARNHNKIQNSLQIQSNSTKNAIQTDASLNLRHDEKEPRLISKKTTDQSTQTDSTHVVTPFRKIFTRNYKFQERNPRQQNLNCKRKQKVVRSIYTI